MTEDARDKLAETIAKLEGADAFERERFGHSYWAKSLESHVRMWIGDQNIVHVRHEWHYGDPKSARTSRTGLMEPESLSLVVFTDVYVLRVVVQPAAEEYDEPVIAASTLVPRSSLKTLTVEPRSEHRADNRHGLRFTLEYPALTGTIQIPPAVDSDSMTDADVALLPGLRDDFFAEANESHLVIIA